MLSKTLGCRATRLTPLLILISVVSAAFAVASFTPSAARAASPVRNSAIADKALQYNGQWGAKASVDAGVSGYTGGAPLGNGDNMDGECRAFVNAILRMTLGINTAYGTDDYQRAFRENGGQPISRAGGMKGDVVQWGNGSHTAIIVSNIDGNGTYQVVDSNYVAHHVVGVHNWTVPSDAQIWRMGTVHVSIYSRAAGKYVTAELGYGGNDYAMLRARATNPAGWESFSLLGDCSRQCALRSDANGKFVSAELGYQGYAWGEMRARSGASQGWEQLRFVGNCDSSCAILALSNSRYLTTELGYTGAGQNMLRARATSASGWEQYVIH
jgi:hypothetical protein